LAGLAFIGELLAPLHSDGFTCMSARHLSSEQTGLLTDAATAHTETAGTLRCILAGKDGMRG